MTTAPLQATENSRATRRSLPAELNRHCHLDLVDVPGDDHSLAAPAVGFEVGLRAAARAATGLGALDRRLKDLEEAGDITSREVGNSIL